MPGFAFALYLLLAFRIQGEIKAFADERCAAVRVTLRGAGAQVMYEVAYTPDKDDWLAQVLRRIVDRDTSRLGKGILKRIRWGLMRAAALQDAEVFLRIGTGDARSTALAAGGIRAALLAAAGGLAAGESIRVHVRPDFAAERFGLELRCIFSAAAGDIMLEAANAALTKKRNEGMRWNSIPSRA